MILVFVDAAFYVALINLDDENHALAVEAFESLRSRGRFGLVTTHAVILEVLAFFSRLGPELRASAAEFVTRTRGSTMTTVLPITDEILDRALALYVERPDQRYSLADCTSMVIARDFDIREILTTDRDFVAEGFEILMRPR